VAATAAVVSIAVAAYLYLRRPPPDTHFAQAQSFIEEFNGSPLLSANWDGHFRPYLFGNGQFDALLPHSIDANLERVDLYSPTPVTARHIVMAGHTAGRSPFDLYLYDVEAQSLRNLTDSPDVDDGDFCAERSKGLLSFRSGRRQRFMRVAPDGVASIADPVATGFDRCIWTSEEQMIGVRGRQPPYQLSVCTVAAPRVTCTPSDALSGVDHFVDFFVTPERRVGVIARKRDTPFRRPYFLAPPGLVDVTEREFPPGDVLEYDGAHARMGLHSKYWTTQETSPDGSLTLFKMKRIGERYVAIAADAETGKTLAELQAGTWKLVKRSGREAPAKPAKPLEIWLRSRKGKLHQAVYFGPLAPTDVVLWLHGGPKENVSPRFNPYFHWLNRHGFGVLALNYPGSTGRGVQYEGQFASNQLADALQAALDYLWSHHVEKVVSWSISTGHHVQLELIAHRFGVSAVIDQAGRDPRPLRAQAARQQIPSLSIIGRNDTGGDDDTVDIRYPGGHDITFEPDFRMVMAKVEPFLRAAPVWRYHAPPALDGELVLDPAHSGNARDPNRHHGLTESELTFQLAHTLMNTCLTGRRVTLTRTGSATLEKSPIASVKGRALLLESNPEAKLLSLHFNASSGGAKSENLTSAFVSIRPGDGDKRFASALVAAMQGIGIGPKLSYPELSKVPLQTLEPGVFARDLHLLRRSEHGRLHLRQSPPRVMFEVAYYDDDAESQKLKERSLSADGTWVSPRIEQIASAICPAIIRFFGENEPS